MKVSYVIPSHNAAAWLPLAVNSVLAQEYKDIELIIVNDGSTDSTGKYLDWLHGKYPKTVIMHHGRPEGRSAARNAGNALATGDIICVLDADDIALPNRTKLTVERFEKGAKFVHGISEVTDAVGQRFQGEIGVKPFDLEDALKNKLNGIVHSSVAYTKELAMKYRYLDGECAKLGLDDWAQQISMATDGVKFTFIPSVICRYRRLQTAISKTRNEADVLAFKEKFLETRKVKA